MTNSEKIDKVKEFIESLGFSVELFSKILPDDVSGRTYYTSCHVAINCVTAKEALYTILHEAGHVFSYDKYFRKLQQNQPNVELREKYAYLYGWGISKQLNLGISKEEWRFEEFERQDVVKEFENDPGFLGL